MVSQHGLGEGEADRAGGQDILYLNHLGGEAVGSVPDVVIASQAVDTLGQAWVDPPGMRCFVIIARTEQQNRLVMLELRTRE